MRKWLSWGVIFVLLPLPASAAKMVALINRDHPYWGNDYATQYETQVFIEWAQNQGLDYQEIRGASSLEQVFQNLDQYEMIVVDTNAIRDGAGYNPLFHQYKGEIKRWVENGGKLIVLGEYHAQVNPGTTGGDTGNAYEWLEVMGITGVWEGGQHTGHDVGWIKAGDPVFSGITEQDLENSSAHPSGNNYWSVLRLVEGHPDADKWEILAKNEAGEILMARGRFGKGVVLVTSWEIGYGQGAFGTLFTNTLTYAKNYGRRRPAPGPGLPEALLVGLMALFCLAVVDAIRRRGKGA